MLLFPNGSIPEYQSFSDGEFHITLVPNFWELIYPLTMSYTFSLAFMISIQLKVAALLMTFVSLALFEIEQDKASLIALMANEPPLGFMVFSTLSYSRHSPLRPWWSVV